MPNVVLVVIAVAVAGVAGLPVEREAREPARVVVRESLALRAAL